MKRYKIVVEFSVEDDSDKESINEVAQDMRWQLETLEEEGIIPNNVSVEVLELL